MNYSELSIGAIVKQEQVRLRQILRTPIIRTHDTDSALFEMLGRLADSNRGARIAESLLEDEYWTDLAKIVKLAYPYDFIRYAQAIIEMLGTPVTPKEMALQFKIDNARVMRTLGLGTKRGTI